MNILGIPVLLYCRFIKGKSNDLSFGLITQTKLEVYLKDKLWKEVDEIIEDHNSGDLTMFLDGLCLSGKYNKEIEDYLEHHTSDTSSLISGVYNTYVAWEIRSGKWANAVNESQWDGFFNYLEKAEEALHNVSNNKVLIAEANARLVKVYMGLSNKEEAKISFDKSTEIKKDHFLAHVNYFKLITPKWLGEQGDTAVFIDSIKDNNLKEFISLMNYVEIYSDLFYDDEDNAKRNFITQNSDVKTLVNTSTKTIGKSILSIYKANYLACIFNILDDKKSRDVVLKQLSGKFTLYPWAYFGMLSERDVKFFKIGGLL